MLSILVHPDSCNKYFTTPSGTIESIGYPASHQHHIPCRYSVSVDPKYFIIITFEDLEMLSCSNCQCESLIIQDLNCSTNRRINYQRYCGKAIPAPYISCGNSVQLTLNTNIVYRQTSQYYGFRLKYQAIEEGKHRFITFYY